MTITSTQTLNTEIVLSERKVSTDYRIIMIRENIRDRVVDVEIELGPFVTRSFGPEDDPRTETVAEGGRRGVTVWENDEYDAIRDTWANSDLIAAVAAKLNA